MSDQENELPTITSTGTMAWLDENGEIQTKEVQITEPLDDVVVEHELDDIVAHMDDE